MYRLRLFLRRLRSRRVTHSSTPSAVRPVKGKVVDDSGEPLIGVTIKNSRSGEVAASDYYGAYQIEGVKGDVITYSFIGMKEESMVIGQREIYNVTLKSDAIALGDVVITGYQTISKERATGSFAVISPKEIESKLQTNIMDRIEGAVAGLNIVKNGNSKSIQIRGVSTINGNKNPLFVVDGIPFEGEPSSGSDNTSPLDLINPSDIVNVTVLKDATAASIYGARSANGVIVITTKQGQKGKTRVNYTGNITFQGLPDREYSHLMSSSELVDYQQMMMQSYPNVKRQTARYCLNATFRIQKETTNGFTKDYYTKDSYTVNTMINDAAQIKEGKINYIIPVGGQVLQDNIDNFSWTVRGQVDYNKQIKSDHKIQALVGAEARKVVTSSNGFYRLGYDDDNLSYSKIDELALTQGVYGTEALYGSFWFTNKTPETTYVDNRYISFYGNASYEYKNKLTLTASIRMDQSNLFGTDPKYQYRPLWSVGAHYVALKDYNWIDRLVVPILRMFL